MGEQPQRMTIGTSKGAYRDSKVSVYALERMAKSSIQVYFGPL